MLGASQEALAHGIPWHVAYHGMGVHGDTWQCVAYSGMWHTVAGGTWGMWHTVAHGGMWHMVVHGTPWHVACGGTWNTVGYAT